MKHANKMPSAVPHAPLTLDRPRIAIVEDDPDFRAIIAGWLRPSYDTVSFASAEEWFAGDKDAPAPDLLITDVVMPGAGGFKLCAAVRAHPAYKALPILFLTGVDNDIAYILGLKAGGSAYLTKPVDRKVLLTTIEELIEQERDRKLLDGRK